MVCSRIASSNRIAGSNMIPGIIETSRATGSNGKLVYNVMTGSTGIAEIIEPGGNGIAGSKIITVECKTK